MHVVLADLLLGKLIEEAIRDENGVKMGMAWTLSAYLLVILRLQETLKNN